MADWRNPVRYPDGRIDVILTNFMAGAFPNGVPSTLSADDPETAELHAEVLAAEAAGEVTVADAVPRAPTSEAVDAERDRRIRAGFLWDGHGFDYDTASQARILGAAQMAVIAKGAGAQPGDYGWAGGGAFGWISADNGIVPLDVDDMIAMGIAAASHERAHIFAARAIKEAVPIPTDFVDDAYWPTAPT